MNRVIQDYLSRWKWLFIGAAALQLLFALGAVFGGILPTIFPVVLAAALPLMIDSVRGCFRLSVTLPVDRRKLATQLWCLGVLAPAGVTFGIAWVVQLLERLVSGGSRQGVDSLIVASALTFLTSGTAYFALLGLRLGPVRGFRRHALDGFYGALWGIVCGLTHNFVQVAPTTLGEARIPDGLFVGLTTWATVCGFRRREVLLVKRARPAQERAPRNHDANAIHAVSNPKLAGMAYLVWQQLRMAVTLGLALVGMSVAAALLLGWQSRGAVEVSFVGSILQGETGQGMLGIWFLFSAVTLVPLMSLRVLRALPISASRLAAHMVASPILCNGFLLLGICGLASLVGVSANLSVLLPMMLVGSATVIIGMVVVLRFGLSWMVYLILFVGGMVGMSMNLSAVAGVPSFTWTVFLGVVAVGCWCVIVRLLTGSRRPYGRELIRITGWS